MRYSKTVLTVAVVLGLGLMARLGLAASEGRTAPPLQTPTDQADKTVTQADCTASRLGTAIPSSAIGEPVSSVALSPPQWVAAAGSVPAHCAVDGTMAPVDRSATAKPINFRVVLPAAWTRRSATGSTRT